MKFYVVGSALRRKRPRDTDLLAVMEDTHFRAAYGLEPDELAMLHDLGGDTVDGDPGGRRDGADVHLGSRAP